MKKEVKTYEDEFKKSSIELFYQSGKGQKPFARELGVNGSTFRGWLKKYGKFYEPEPATDRETLNRYRKDLAYAQMENDLLKKTIAIFTRNMV